MARRPGTWDIHVSHHSATGGAAWLGGDARLAGPGPGADEALLAGSDDAVLQEQKHGEALLSDLLAHQRLQQWDLMDSRAQGCAQHLGWVQAAGRVRVRARGG